MMFSKSDISLVLFMLSYYSSNMADQGTMFRDVYGDFKDPVLPTTNSSSWQKK